MRFQAPLSCIALLALVLPARADKDWPVPRGPSREPAPFKYDSKIWDKVPKAFLEDSPACILYAGTTHRIEADGTVETTTHDITRFNGRKGIESLGEYRHIYFDPTYQKLTLNEAHIIKKDGSIVFIEPRHLQLRDVGTDYQIYYQDKQLVISFPNLEVGDAYEVKWTVRGKDREFGGQYFSRYTFGDDRLPVVRDELHVFMPKNKTLKHAAINGKLDPVIRDLDEWRHLSWGVDNRPEFSRDEDRPSKEELRLQVAISTYASWEDVGLWKQKLRAECWKCTPEIHKVVDDVTKSLKTPLEKARALTYWVRQHIRYVSRGPSGLGYTPHEPAKVLANLFGDCKDQTQLLAVMLKEVGLDPWLVTIGARDDGQVVEAVPSPWGSHALLMVPIDGRNHWIDTTVAQAPWNYLPKSDRGRQAYLTRGEELKLMRTPPLTYHDNRYEQTTVVQVRSDGTSHGRRSMFYHGASAMTRRAAWIEVPAGERRRLMTAELQDANPRTRLVGLAVDERSLTDFDKPVQAQVEFLIPRHFPVDKDREASFTDSHVWNRLLAYNLDPERRLPLILGNPFESVHLYVIQLPAAYRFDGLPSPKSVTSPWGFYKLKVEQDAKDPRRLELVMHMRLEKTRVDKADFAAFQKFHEEVNKAYRVWVYLKSTLDLADAPALETLWALLPGSDPHTARVLAKLYLHHEKHAEARRLLKSARALHVNDQNFWELSVQAAANRAEEEQLYSEMVKRFPEQSKFALALGEVRVQQLDFVGAKIILEPLTKSTAINTKAKAHYHLARGLFQEKQSDKALENLEAAYKADPHVFASATIFHFKARVQEELGRIGPAIDSYRQALEFDGKDQSTLASLIRLEIQANKTKDALDHLRRYTLTAGKDRSALVKAAEFHWRLGRIEDAFELASRARELGFHAGGQRILGLVHARKGEWPQAVFHFDRADLDAEARCALAASHVALGQVEQSARAAEPGKDALAAKGGWDERLHKTWETTRVLLARRDTVLRETKHPKDKAAAWTRAAEALVCAEQLWTEKAVAPRVEELLAKVFAEKADLAPAFSLRAWLHLDKGQLTKALADAQRAADLSPADVRALVVRGRVRLERAQLDGALADLRRALEQSDRADPWIYHWLAAALQQLGRHDEAIAAQREAVRLAPAEAEFQLQLRALEKSKRS